MYDPEKITYFAETDSRNKRVPFGIKAKDRARHMYVIGKTGVGKSTLLENMAIQDIQAGEGIAFLDPHGGTAEKLLDYVPEERIKDVLYFAPFDLENPVSFNIMEDIGVDKRHLVASGLMSTFEKIWVDAWSARMAYILSNTLLALLEYPGSTLLGVNRMLSDKEYRTKVVANIQDAAVKSFWVDEFAKYTDKYAAEATPAIQNKVGQFTANPLVRNIIGQPKSSFDLRDIMDNRKILIVNLSKGRVGEGNANLIGSMLITKLYLAAMSRADKNEAELSKLPNFYLYVDEFQSFANKSFADILSEARKYKLNLHMAHQYIEQMEEEVRDAVFGNVGTMVSFRVGALDAELLEKEFAPVFTAEDLVNLGFAQIYLKLMIDGISSPPFSARTIAPIPRPEVSHRDEVIASSRQQFARPRAVVEAEITKDYEDGRVQEVKAPSGERRFTDSRQTERREPKPMDFRGKRADAPRAPYKDERPRPDFARQKEEVRIRKEAVAELPSDDFKPLSSISIHKVEKQRDNQRKPSPQNVNDLRSALASLVKPTGNKVIPSQTAHSTPPRVEQRSEPRPIVPPRAPVPQQKPVPRAEKPVEKPKELSTDTLKSVLGVE